MMIQTSLTKNYLKAWWSGSLWSSGTEDKKERIKSVAPRQDDTPEEATQKFLLFCCGYFPTVFYNQWSPSQAAASKSLHETRWGRMNELLWVGTGGVGKTAFITAEVVYSILFKTEPLTVYQSAVQGSTYSFVPRVIQMIAAPNLVYDFGFFVTESMIGADVAEKKRSQKRTDFTFTNGSRVVASNLFSSVRGLIHSDVGVQTSKITTLIMDDIATSQSSLSARLKGRVGEAMIEARRSLDKSNSRTILLSNISKGENYAQQALKEKSMPYLLTPLTDDATYYDGEKEQKLPKMEHTGTNLADVYTTEKQARAHNQHKPDHLHASWVDREYKNAGANWQWECECRFWESSNLIFGKHDGKVDQPQIITVQRDKQLHLYPFNEDEYVYIGCDLGGGRDRDPSAIVGLTESGVVCLGLAHARTTPDRFAEVIRDAAEYTKHYMVVIEDDGGSGAECIRAVRKLIPDTRVWREVTHDKTQNKRSVKFGWTPTAAKIELIMDKLAEAYPGLQLNHQPLIEQCQIMTWDHLKERDTSLLHHFDLLRCLAMANHVRDTMKLLKG